MSDVGDIARLAARDTNDDIGRRPARFVMVWWCIDLVLQWWLLDTPMTIARASSALGFITLLTYAVFVWPRRGAKPDASDGR